MKTCARRGVIDDPFARQRPAQAWIEVEIFRLHNARTLTRLSRGGELGPEASLVKLWWAGVSQRLYETATAVLGADALLASEDAHAIDGGRWAHELLATRANSIQGGTSEIQRNIVGERLLGLPREPR
jgi:alkylation response protein AidB-like acyl-CoA dehydrogenase